MTVEALLFTALDALVAGRVFPDVAPTNTVRPYLTYQQVGGEVVAMLDNGVPSKQHGRFQINVWAATRGQAASLALQIESALIQASGFQARPLIAPVADYDSDMLLYGSRQDFSIWSDR